MSPYPRQPSRPWRTGSYIKCQCCNSNGIMPNGEECCTCGGRGTLYADPFGHLHAYAGGPELHAPHNSNTKETAQP